MKRDEEPLKRCKGEKVKRKEPLAFDNTQYLKGLLRTSV
jgi:hypothetical protein